MKTSDALTLGAACFALLICGCSSPEMKGTPFYTGEYQLNVPNADIDRVNVWPLVYYRAPSLSVLWPIFEKTEEHLAVRPLYSAYGDTTEYWEHNLLWPWGQINARDHSNRLPPFFWGQTLRRGGSPQNYQALVPLYWNFDDELNTLLPLWYVRHSEPDTSGFTDHDYWFAGPLARYHQAKQRTDWHVALFGRYHDEEDESSFAGYPFPLLMTWHDRQTKGFFSPLYARNETRDDDFSEGWEALPALLSLRSWSKDDNDRWLLGPLVHVRSGKEVDGWHAALFGRYVDRHDGSTYTGLPWPLLFSWRTEQAQGLFSPAFVRQESVGKGAPRGFCCVPPLLSWHVWNATARDYWLLGPLCEAHAGNESSAWRIATFGHYANTKTGTSYAGYPWPLLFSWRDPQEHGLFSPLYAYQEDNNDRATAGSALIPPLLYWHSWSGGADDYWIGGPIAHFHRSPECVSWRFANAGSYRYPQRGESYAGYPWPLVWTWRNAKNHGLFSPFYAYQESSSPNVTDGWCALPLLLSWRTWGPSEDNLCAMLGLFGERRTRDNRTDHLFPLYAYDRRDDRFATPLFGWDKPDPREPTGTWYALTPLVGAWSGATRGGWLFPFFSHERTLGADDYATSFLLLGHVSLTHAASKGGENVSFESAFFPLFHHDREAFSTPADRSGVRTEGRSTDTHALLAYSSDKATTSFAPRGAPPAPGTNAAERALHAQWAKHQKRGDRVTRRSSSGIFPLWMSSTQSESRPDGTSLSTRDDHRLLLLLFDSKRDFQSGEDGEPLDYTRRRVLWRLWHYEKRNGDASADLFPFITHDAHADGFRKTSFLWRFYRYEKSKDGKVALDLFFIPLRRD